MKCFWRVVWILAVATKLLFGQPGQLSIPLVEQMPRLPQTYQMIDWQNLARAYDSLVFNEQLSGEYLPLIWIAPSGVNYPETAHFGLVSYVGSNTQNQAEAINVLAALVSASLVGIDKTNQFGRNFIEMSRDFFNKRNDENVYLNNFQTSSGNDWWYDTMPNVFFYQLYDLYSDKRPAEYEYQFKMVADRWLQALKKMGGSTTPWQIPNLNHRGWRLSTMEPNDNSVREPEAAGALGWLMYMAYTQLKDEKYRIAAEWCMEFLDQWPVNPSYELQLPYGVYLAARMNAELRTNYDVKKMLNWCFDYQDNVRGWGVTVGTWGGYDCSGLVGEVIGDDYAFAMNTFEMIGALLPMVRYDERFARAIARWILNAASAARLFYSPFLPAENQDSEDWAYVYDPQGVIAYEALREYGWYSQSGPFATGDAKRNGWAQTNLALYGASHAGILGGVIDTTDVRGILKLDVRKTDYFARSDSQNFAMFLFYNPYPHDTSVALQLSQQSFDVYDLLTNSDLMQNVSGSVRLMIPADQARLICLLPAGAPRTVENNVLLVDGQPVDFFPAQAAENLAPRIKALAAIETTVPVNGTITLYCTATDPENDSLQYYWQAQGGALLASGNTAQWTAPEVPGKVRILCRVVDSWQQADSAALFIEVQNNHAPRITGIWAEPSEVLPEQTVTLTCQSVDDDGDSLTYVWWVAADTLSHQPQFSWTAPAVAGYYWLHCQVSDAHGARVEDSVGVSVGDLVLYFTFENNDATDYSAFNNDGKVIGGNFLPGVSGTSLFFDGKDDMVLVPLHPSLNFQQGITAAFFLKVDSFFTREAYPLSHGNWENRWKISITNKRVRWTVKTDRGISDLDSKLVLQGDRWYHVTCVYNGAQMKIFIDGQLDAQKDWSGKLLQTSYDLTLGQVLPGNSQYNFRGLLDEVRLYNRGLDDQEVIELYDQETALPNGDQQAFPGDFFLFQNFPNPFNPQTVIRYHLKKRAMVSLMVFDSRGSLVTVLEKGVQTPGEHRVVWKASGLASGVYFFRLQAGTQRMVRKGLKLK